MYGTHEIVRVGSQKRKNRRTRLGADIFDDCLLQQIQRYIKLAVISGNKDSVIGEYVEKRQLNHPRKGPYYPRMPHLILKRAVRGMIPYQKPRGREAFKRLRVDIGTPANLRDEKMEPLKDAQMNDNTKYISLGDVSKILGAKF